MATKKAKTDAARRRLAWVTLVKGTLEEISRWAEAERWAVVQNEKQIEEQSLGAYAVPVLTIQLPTGRLHVEPIARNVAGAEGRIDLLAFPVLNRVSLLRKGGVWIARTDSGVDFPSAWNSKTFVKLAQALANST